ncbi:S8 family serine peptidase, partial [Synechococcus sp. AH-707-B22]|nr:S8 family serine peptidase [Synechococcus sp. AH-707-B22]
MDDDGNGFADDYNGWNFAANSNLLYADDHGTHVAGIIGAEGDNNQGITGVTWDVQLMSLDVFNGGEGAYDQDIIDAIYYAADNGSDVINMSLGSTYSGYTFEEYKSQYSDHYQWYYDAFEYATNKGAVVVIAAGNESSDLELNLSLPAAFSEVLPGVLSVAAVGNTGDLSTYSNYGGLISIAAPGGDFNAYSSEILSTLPGGNYGYMAGTSMAAPIVSGAAALVMAANPDFTPAEVEQVLQSTSNNYKELETFVEGGNFLNLQNALQAALVPVSDLILQYKGNEYLLTTEYGTFLELKDLLVDDPWWYENQDTTQGLAGPDDLVNNVITNVGREWFEVSNDLSYDNYYSEYGGGSDLPVFAALSETPLNQQSTVDVRWLHEQGHSIGDTAFSSANHYYLNATLIGSIGSFVVDEEDKVFHVNSRPTGIPTLSADFKVGQTINIDASFISDVDNFEGWTPTYEYSWEVSDANGTTWTALTSSDATDGDSSFTLTSSEVGKQLRGVVSYLDGYGTNELVESEGSLVTPSIAFGNVDLYVDGGSFSDPYYRFYTDPSGQEELTDLLLDTGSSYTFRRLDGAGTHPFYLSDTSFKQPSSSDIAITGDGSPTSGITGSQSFTLTFNEDAHEIKEIFYYCSSHSSMISSLAIGSAFEHDGIYDNNINGVRIGKDSLNNYILSVSDESAGTTQNIIVRDKDGAIINKSERGDYIAIAAYEVEDGYRVLWNLDVEGTGSINHGSEWDRFLMWNLDSTGTLIDDLRPGWEDDRISHAEFYDIENQFNLDLNKDGDVGDGYIPPVGGNRQLSIADQTLQAGKTVEIPILIS